ncbi:MAG: hypothetical protein PHO28_02025 [Candidatus Pacebacteria bacterium]|nr:hypothetical protein [Candidatus Paceibacterota bacterium]
MKKEDKKLFEKILKFSNKMTDDGSLSSEIREKFQDVAGTSAGLLLNSWLPSGWLRKIIILAIILVVICLAITKNLLFLLLLFILPIFSPRMMGELMFLVGHIKNNSNKPK